VGYFESSYVALFFIAINAARLSFLHPAQNFSTPSGRLLQAGSSDENLAFQESPVDRKNVAAIVNADNWSHGCVPPPNHESCNDAKRGLAGC
jgi:hypothetical protein